MNTTLNRYILKEILPLMLIILFSLTFVLLIGKILQLMDLLINKGIGIVYIGMLFVYLMPSFLIFTLPISLLTAILIGLGRLSADHEITVLKASGVSLYQILTPVAFLSLIIFFLTSVTGILAPYGNRATKDLIFKMAEQIISVNIKERIFNSDFPGLLIYAETIPAHGNYLEGVMIHDRRLLDERGTFIAKKAHLVSDPKTKRLFLRLENGSLHLVDPKLKYYRQMQFSSYDIQLDLGSSFTDTNIAGSVSLPELTVSALFKRLKAVDPDSQNYREVAIALNKKVTIPFSCLVFGLLGVALGIRAHRAVRSVGFTVSLLIVLSYYLLQLASDALVELGHVPIIGVWTPSIIFGTLAAGLFILAAKEIPIKIKCLDLLMVHLRMIFARLVK